MSPTELKMQPTIHLERKAGYGRGKFPVLPSKCIVGCIFNSVGLIITRKSPCILCVQFNILRFCVCVIVIVFHSVWFFIRNIFFTQLTKKNDE
jgi:hypothetical protein